MTWAFFLLFSLLSMVKDINLIRHEIPVGYLQFSDKYVFSQFLTTTVQWFILNSPISVFSCNTPKVLWRSSSSRCMLIVYRDGREGIENGKLRNTSLHVLYIRYSTVNIILCRLVFPVLHGALILINVYGQHLADLALPRPFPWGNINQLNNISVP